MSVLSSHSWLAILGFIIDDVFLRAVELCSVTGLGEHVSAGLVVDAAMITLFRECDP